MSHNPPTSHLERPVAPVRVCVLSDDALLATALARLLGRRADVEVTERARAEVLLWDPGSDDREVDAKLGQLEALGSPAVALLPSGARAQSALSAGARGVMLRDRLGDRLGDDAADPQLGSAAGGVASHLVSALVAVRSGLTVLDAALAEQLLPSDAIPVVPAGITPLTVREQEVITLLAQGLSNKQIAKRLAISGHTAKFHTARILTKLDADSRTEAVVRALRYGMVRL